MIGPCWVPLAVEVLAGSGVKVACDLNFPMANDTLGMKLSLRELAAAGADEFDLQPGIPHRWDGARVCRGDPAHRHQGA